MRGKRKKGRSSQIRFKKQRIKREKIQLKPTTAKTCHAKAVTHHQQTKAQTVPERQLLWKNSLKFFC